MAVTLFVQVNDGMSPNALVDHAAEYKAARDAMRGRDSKMNTDTLANIRVFGGVIWSVVLALGLYAARKRFYTEDPESGDAIPSSNPLS